MTGSRIFGVSLNRCLKPFTGEMKMKRYAKSLISAVADEDMFDRYRAEKAPGEMGGSRAVDPPIQVLEIKWFEKLKAAALEIVASRNMTALPPNSAVTETKKGNKNESG